MNAYVINMNAGSPFGQIHDAFQHAVPPDQGTVQKSRDGCSGSQNPILQKLADDHIFPSLHKVFAGKLIRNHFRGAVVQDTWAPSTGI